MAARNTMPTRSASPTVSQRKVAQQPIAYRSAAQQSDLRLFERLESLSPAQLARVWNGLPRHTQIISLVFTAIAVLLWCVVSIVSLVTTHIENTRGPFLDAALEAPYQINARAFPPDPMIVPTQAGDSTLTNTPVFTDPFTGSLLPADVVHPMSPCLNQVLAPVEPLPCVMQVFGQSALYTEYTTVEGQVARLVMVHYSSTDEAATALGDLFQYASANGATGNFSLGVMTTSYFYSGSATSSEFTWARNDWLFSISTGNVAMLDAFMEHYPY